MKKRVILIVADSMGIGALPDADQYGDAGANTFLHIANQMGASFQVPYLARLGIGEIQGLEALSPGRSREPLSPGKGTETGGTDLAEEKQGAKDGPSLSIIGAYGRMKEKSAGKDTITGHWELAGLETHIPFKTYPNGFPEAFIHIFQERIGRRVIGNYAESGTVIIEKLGPQHEETGFPIVYTSSDSVFQIAANIDVIPLETLYDFCRTARELLVGDWACGRVIARPYRIIEGKRTRTSDRRDFAVDPPQETLLDKVKKAGQEVYAIGKIHDIFNGRGISRSVHTEDNEDGMDKTLEAMQQVDQGLIFTNLVDFDSKFGHRRNPVGYGEAIMRFDSRIPDVMQAMRPGDLFIITADHGNDPTHSGFDHTREYIPCLVYGKAVKGGSKIGTRDTFADIGATIAHYLGTEAPPTGKSFLPIIEV